MRRSIEKLKYLFHKLIHGHSSVDEVSWGFAIGIFLGFLPIMGIQMVVGLFFTTVFKKNPWAAMIAVWVTNPVTFIPIYLFNYWIGLFFYKDGLNLEEVRTIFENITLTSLLDLGAQILVPLVIGSLIVATVASIIGYFMCHQFYLPLKARLLKK